MSLRVGQPTQSYSWENVKVTKQTSTTVQYRLSKESWRRLEDIRNGFMKQIQSLETQRDEQTRSRLEQGEKLENIHKDLNGLQSQIDALYTASFEAEQNMLAQVDPSEIVSKVSTPLHAPDGFSPAQRPLADATTPVRERLKEDKSTAESTSVSRQRKRKPLAEKSGFQPLFANNPSMSNSLRRKGDRLTISESGKLEQLMQHIEERKEALAEQKQLLVENTLARGGSLEDIEEPLKGFEEQMLALDEQLAEALSRQTQLMAEELHPKRGGEEKKAETDPRQDSPEGRIFQLSHLASRMAVSETALKTSGEVKGASRIATAELKLDDLRVETRYYRRIAEEKIAGLARGESGGKPSPAEMQSMRAARRAYAKEMRQVERETAQEIARLDEMGAENLGEVQESLRPAPPEQEEPGEEKEMAPSGQEA